MAIAAQRNRQQGNKGSRDQGASMPRSLDASMPSRSADLRRLASRVNESAGIASSESPGQQLAAEIAANSRRRHEQTPEVVPLAGAGKVYFDDAPGFTDKSGEFIAGVPVSRLAAFRGVNPEEAATRRLAVVHDDERVAVDHAKNREVAGRDRAALRSDLWRRFVRGRTARRSGEERDQPPATSHQAAEPRSPVTGPRSLHAPHKPTITRTEPEYNRGREQRRAAVIGAACLALVPIVLAFGVSRGVQPTPSQLDVELTPAAVAGDGAGKAPGARSQAPGAKTGDWLPVTGPSDVSQTKEHARRT